eukprot:2346364-Rhodomonas_salina.4
MSVPDIAQRVRSSLAHVSTGHCIARGASLHSLRASSYASSCTPRYSVSTAPINASTAAINGGAASTNVSSASINGTITRSRTFAAHAVASAHTDSRPRVPSRVPRTTSKVPCRSLAAWASLVSAPT